MHHKLFDRSSDNVKPFAIFTYEIKILNEAYALLKSSITGDHSSALLESFLLHTRNLIDFFEDKYEYSDDLTCRNFTDLTQNPIKGIKLNFNKDFREALNKHLSHMTTVRIKSKPGWLVDDIRKEINNAALLFIQNCSDENFDNHDDKKRAVEKLKFLLKSRLN